MLSNLNQLRHQRREHAHAAAKAGGEALASIRESGRQLGKSVAALEDALATVEAELYEEASRLPNDTHPDTPTDDEPRVLGFGGAMPSFAFEPRDHVDLGTALGLVDFPSAASASGSGFYYLTGHGALLELALVQLAVDTCLSRGFAPVSPPDLARVGLVRACGYSPRAGSDPSQLYALGGHHAHLALVATAEIPLAGLFMDRIVEPDRLPQKLVAWGHCFRAEAGAYGAETRGLYRVHQFTKVEMFAACAAHDGSAEALLQEMIGVEREILDALGLHYRVLMMPATDLGAPAYCKYDIEAWMPGRRAWGELTSASHCTSYQARRLGARYRVHGHPTAAAPRHDSPATEFIHTINATALAVPRTIVALLETHQQADGSIAIPHALQRYLGGESALRQGGRWARASHADET